MNMYEEEHPMDRDYKKGQRLYLNTRDESFEGTVHYVDPDHGMLILRDVIYHPSGKERETLYRVYRVEVNQIVMLDDGGEAEAAAKEEKNKARLRYEGYMKVLETAQDSIFISSIGNLFKQAVRAINAESVIGIHVEGRFRRGTKLSLLCVSTPDRIFTFDIQTLGEEAFSNGLRAVLESTEIEKIIHNCRLISDCLKHTYEVTLNCVFDTQVADLTVTKQHQGEFPRLVRSIPECLAKYLNLPETILHLPKFNHREYYMNWRTRPLPMELQVAAAKSTVFLFELRKEIYAEMMKPFHVAVNLFCDVVRSGGDYEADQHRGAIDKVPRELLTLKED